MKYSVNINQRAAMEAGLDLDLVDMAIFDVLTVYTNSTACRRMSEHGSAYFHVPYQVVIDELPLAKITKPDSVYRRFQKMEQCGIMHLHADNKKMKQVWFRWGRNYDILHFETGSKSGQSPIPSVQTSPQTGSKSGLRPDQNPGYNNTNQNTLVECASPARTHEGLLPVKTEGKNPLPPFPPPPLPDPGDPPALSSANFGAPSVEFVRPDWGSRLSQANTPQEVQRFLSNFYFPEVDGQKTVSEEWRVLTDYSDAKHWPPDKVKEVTLAFSEHIIKTNRQSETLRQMNARLQRWLREQRFFERKPLGDAAPQEVCRAPKNLITRNPHSFNQ